jgi:hypothetical protein
MVRRPAEEQKARIHGPVEGLKRDLREGRCLSSDAFLKGVFVLHLKNALQSSTLGTSIVFQGIVWWSQTFSSNLDFGEKGMR